MTSPEILLCCSLLCLLYARWQVAVVYLYDSWILLSSLCKPQPVTLHCALVVCDWFEWILTSDRDTAGMNCLKILSVPPVLIQKWDSDLPKNQSFLGNGSIGKKKVFHWNGVRDQRLARSQPWTFWYMTPCRLVESIKFSLKHTASIFMVEEVRLQAAHHFSATTNCC